MKTNFSGNDFVLGILGGGQLGRMLIQKAADYNISMAVMDGDVNAPCKNLCSRFVNEKFSDYDAVYRFGKSVSLLTLEIEHVNTEALFQLEKEGLPVYPQPTVLNMVKDKGLQKIFYRTHGIPTAAFKLIEKKEDLWNEQRPFPYIIKLRKDGYDGKGVMKINSKEDLQKVFSAPFLIEECIDFEREISVIVARNKDGEIKAFPAVEMDFNPEANLVEFLFSPSRFHSTILSESEKIACNLIDQLQMVGLLAVEMFVTKEGKILVNEIAPRPHNSGHHTIEANVTSQYEQHLRAILNLPLGDTSVIRPAVMVNLLGEKGFSGEAYYDGLEEVMQMPGTYVHLYGKKETRPFRKMGHVTITADTLDDAIKLANKVKQHLKVKSVQ